MGGTSRAFDIKAADQVLLVMLGSQPTVKAMHTYLDQAATLGQSPDGAMRWIFFACGAHQHQTYRNLYIHMSKPSSGDAAALAAWEQKALDMGMITWEAGNAYYLIKKVGATLVTPETLATTVLFPTNPHSSPTLSQ